MEAVISYVKPITAIALAYLCLNESHALWLGLTLKTPLMRIDKNNNTYYRVFRPLNKTIVSNNLDNEQDLNDLIGSKLKCLKFNSVVIIGAIMGTVSIAAPIGILYPKYLQWLNTIVYVISLIGGISLLSEARNHYLLGKILGRE